LSDSELNQTPGSPDRLVPSTGVAEIDGAVVDVGGDVPKIVRANDWGVVAAELLAEMVKSYGLSSAVPADGTPEIVAVPSPLSVNDTPSGKTAAPSDRDGVGYPVVVTVKLDCCPTEKDVLSSLDTVGA
jgi:hypothetical protein